MQVPRDGFFGTIYRWYLHRVLPRVGRAISGDASAYSYLPASVSRFFLPEELVELMRRVGYRQAKYENWTGGTVAVHPGPRCGYAPSHFVWGKAPLGKRR